MDAFLQEGEFAGRNSRHPELPRKQDHLAPTVTTHNIDVVDNEVTKPNASSTSETKDSNASPEDLLAEDRSSKGGSGIIIHDREGDIVVSSFMAAAGEARIIAEMVRANGTLILRGVHIEGKGTLKEALEAAREFGREQGVKEVIIEGGRRTTGRRPGHFPKPIKISTGL